MIDDAWLYPKSTPLPMDWIGVKVQLIPPAASSESPTEKREMIPLRQARAREFLGCGCPICRRNLDNYPAELPAVFRTCRDTRSL